MAMPPGGPGAPDAAIDDAGRPVDLLPVGQLIRLSLYWLGLTSIFAGLAWINSGRIQYQELVPQGQEGSAMFLINIAGVIVAIAVQPTIGAISDYTITRWGRRKPYIFIGTTLDLVFLLALTQANSLLAIAVLVTLLQFSSNFAQGPFQGYVPDLVPAPQVGLASALVGLMQVLGNVSGFLIGIIAVSTREYGLGLVALGVLEFVTMLSVVIRVDDGKIARQRGGRSWRQIAASAWGTDILQERSYVWLVASRLFVLMAGAMLTNHIVFYLAQTQGLPDDETLIPGLTILGVVVIANVIAVVPAARASDRYGRKPLIYLSCLVGALGLGTVAVAPSVPVAVLGAALFGLSAGTFLAVDWALMTDIIPKASSGRYMGISNLATGSAGILAQMFGGALAMDLVNRLLGYGTGPRVTMLLGVVCFGLGAWFLRYVNERRRELGDAPSDADAVVIPEPA